MVVNKFKALSFALVLVAVVSAFVVFPMLPSRVPVHWNAAGDVDRFGEPEQAAFIFPGMMALVLLVFVLIPKIAVFKENLKAFEKHYWALAFLLEFFFAMFFVLTLAPNFGFDFKMSQPILVLVALLIAVIGVMMPSFKRNFFVGIRTPWTLANDEVWDKTHKLGGKLFIAAGVLAAVIAFLPGQNVFIAIAPILVAVVVVFVYSYFVFSKTGKKQL